jgi:hypothetical protein
MTAIVTFLAFLAIVFTGNKVDAVAAELAAIRKLLEAREDL